MATVVREHHTLGRWQGRPTLEQRFLFRGEGATAAALAGVLLSAPLVGRDSIFGERPGEDDPSDESTRILRGFSPAPGFRFDVRLEHTGGGVFVVRFSQPHRRVPYLEGGLVWTVADVDGGAILDEQINTRKALEVVSQPLDGKRLSLRRWLFFRAGHGQVMRGATRSLAALIGHRAA